MICYDNYRDNKQGKQTNQKRFEILVDLMRSHTHLSKGLFETADAKTTSINLCKNFDVKVLVHIFFYKYTYSFHLKRT